MQDQKFKRQLLVRYRSTIQNIKFDKVNMLEITCPADAGQSRTSNLFTFNNSLWKVQLLL